MPIESIGTFSQGLMRGLQQAQSRQEELSHKKELLKLEQDKLKLSEKEMELKQKGGGLEEILQMLKIQTERGRGQNLQLQNQKLEAETKRLLDKAMREDKARENIRTKSQTFTQTGQKPTPVDTASMMDDLVEIMTPNQALDYMKGKGWSTPDDKEPEKIVWTKWVAKQLGTDAKGAITWLTQQQGRSQFLQTYVMGRVNNDMKFMLATPAEQNQLRQKYLKEGNQLADEIITAPGNDTVKSGGGLGDVLGSEYDDIFNVGE
jgi:hypothetical protein